jgi:prevent-host-death family protein
MKIATAAVEAGIPVLPPMQKHGRDDLAFELTGRRCTPGGYVRSSYAEDEIDLLAAYCGELDRCYLLPRELVVGRSEIWLRVSPTLNGQRACLNLAAEYEFHGAVAQLEERVAGSHEVRGSSPLSSTSPPPAVQTGCHDFRNRFGYYLERAAAGTTIEVPRRGRPYARLVPAAPVDMCPELRTVSKGGPGVADRPPEVA